MGGISHALYNQKPHQGGIDLEEKIMKTGIELIAQERAEQIEKHKWDAAHDALHEYGELRKMAAVLCCVGTDAFVGDVGEFSSGNNAWGLEEKLKKDAIHRLKVAGALIAAEIDRLIFNDSNNPPCKE